MRSFEYLSTKFLKPIDLTSQRLDPHGVPRKAGMVLPNGAILLSEVDVRVFTHRVDSIVLAVATGYQPFITWHRMISTDCPFATGGYHIVDTCDSGHYHVYLEEAIREFKERVDGNRSMIERDGTLVQV